MDCTEAVELTEVSVMPVVETLGALLLLLSVARKQTDGGDWWRAHGGSGADRSVGGDGGGDALGAAVAAVCVSGSRLNASD